MNGIPLPRLTVSLGLWQDRPPSEALETARHADELGYDELWIGEMATFDAFALATSIGLGTRRIALTVGPLAVAVRDPMMVAMGAASVAHLTGRQVGIAIGTSSPTVVESWHGRATGGAVGALRESAHALTAFTRTGTAEVRGKVVRTSGYRMRLPSRSSSLTIAAFGPASIAVAAAHADRFVMSLVTPRAAEQRVEVLRRECDRLARARPRVAAWVPVAVASDERVISDSVDQVRRMLVGYLGAPGYAEMFAEAGFEEVVEFARTKPHPTSLAAAIPRALVELVGVFGDARTVRRRLAEFSPHVDEIAVLACSTPGDPAGSGTLGALRDLVADTPSRSNAHTRAGVASKVRPRHVVIVGGGVAGHAAAAALRERGYEGRIALVGAEAHEPYDRPPLSKEFLSPGADFPALKPALADLDVEHLRSRRAFRLDDAGLHVQDTHTGATRTLDYDGLIIATGSAPRRLPGLSRLPRLLELRTLDDARRLKAALVPARRVVVIGAGWLGAEVATAAAALGCDVRVVDAASTVLASALPPEIGRHVERWYERAGIALSLAADIERVDESGVLLRSGELLEADVVVVGIGARPATAWLADSAVDLGPFGEVVADARLAAGPSVYAIGDAVSWPSARFGARVRTEHWDHACASARVAAANLLGADQTYDPVPMFWSDQLGRRLRYVGRHTAQDRLSWCGDPAGEGPWSAQWRRDGRLRAALTVDDSRGAREAFREISRVPLVDTEAGGDPSDGHV
ncbi:LLM class F420-dependent oxidoreductase [Embleya sp. NPDC127516]|uniref:LLM class F420-dependent oxidoreductase n=1 Tax=Embleya sp. NPDC127516 TaxID=3363990 RepID=UPI00382B5E23